MSGQFQSREAIPLKYGNKKAIPVKHSLKIIIENERPKITERPSITARICLYQFAKYNNL
jgi:hypothetical protein